MKKSVISIIFSVCIIIFTGCSSKTEVRERAFIQAAAVENKNGYTAVAVRLFEDDNLYYGEGSDFFDAVSDAELQQDKYFFTGHMEFIVSSEKNNRDILETLIKSNKIPPSCYVMYNNDSLRFIDGLDCDLMNGIIKIRYENNKALKKDIWNVVEDIENYGYSAVDYLKNDNAISEINIR